MTKNAFFVASTGQHVGKTTTCLGLLSGLNKRFSSVGFMKPVGQEHVKIDADLNVDKDVVLIKEYFDLKSHYAEMSPVIFPRGFTRDCLDGKIEEANLSQRIRLAFSSISSQHEFTLIEGTGHIGVGSIVNLSNAQVASLLGLPVLFVVSGGLGSAFDHLALNKALCDQHSVPVLGVILNRVHNEKRDMVIHYMNKALTRWNLPLLGCIPFDPFLSTPSMKDFESLFQTTLLSGEEHCLRHFKLLRLVATSVEAYHEMIAKNQLVITPSNREDIIMATLSKHWDIKIGTPDEDLEAGMILTGEHPPRPLVIEQLKKAHIPALYAPFSSATVMQMISSFTAKLCKEDLPQMHEAIDIVENHLDLDLLLNLLK